MEKKTSITVFGATGKIGSDLLKLLSQAKIPTIAVTRNIANSFPLPFVQWMQADMLDTQSLHPTLAESEAVFLLSGNSPDFVREQKNAIRVAKQAGVAYVVKLSSGVADKKSSYYIPKTHGQVEDFLMTSGMHYTMLRPYGIMQNWLGDIADSVRTERKFYEATANGSRAHVDRRDIAAVAFTCLTNSEKHYDKIYTLTSDRAVNYYEIAAAIADAIGETVNYIPITLEEARKSMQQKDMPYALVETFISYDKAQANGEAALVTDCVQTILGKPARTVEDFFRDYADQFR